MSNFEPKDNSGSVFVNDRKEKDSHPDRQGSCLIDGREYWISGWVKKTKDGVPWLSLAFKAKDAPARTAARPAAPPPRQAPRRQPEEEFDDDIPF